MLASSVPRSLVAAPCRPVSVGGQCRRLHSHAMSHLCHHLTSACRSSNASHRRRSHSTLASAAARPPAGQPARSPHRHCSVPCRALPIARLLACAPLRPSAMHAAQRSRIDFQAPALAYARNAPTPTSSPMAQGQGVRRHPDAAIHRFCIDDSRPRLLRPCSSLLASERQTPIVQCTLHGAAGIVERAGSPLTCLCRRVAVPGAGGPGPCPSPHVQGGHPAAKSGCCGRLVRGIEASPCRSETGWRSKRHGEAAQTSAPGCRDDVSLMCYRPPAVMRH
jgi:hypothetical protein